MKAEEIIQEIVNGRCTIREGSRLLGIDRDRLTRLLREQYKDDEKTLKIIDDQLAENKATSSFEKIEIDEELLKSVFYRIAVQDITIAEARDELNGIDRETLRSRFNEMLADESNAEFVAIYKDYHENVVKNDFSGINFRRVFVSMVMQNMSQSQMAVNLNIPTRQMSRELEKLKGDALYPFVKDYSKQKMQRHTFTPFERSQQLKFLKQYVSDNKELLDKNPRTKTSLRKARDTRIVDRYDELKKAGMSKAEILEKLGVSDSTIRRARRALQNRESKTSVDDTKVVKIDKTKIDYVPGIDD